MERFDIHGHYFIPMRPRHDYGFVSMKSSSDPEYFILCHLEPYHFDGFKYKLIAVPDDPVEKIAFGTETYYTCDFESLVKRGHFIQKTSPTMHVEQVRMAEPLWGDVFIIHEGEMIIDKGEAV